jgi:hypothetical protein
LFNGDQFFELNALPNVMVARISFLGSQNQYVGR